MVKMPIFVCQKCDSEDCELQFKTVDNHKVPTLWHCKRCNWEGKMRKLVYVEAEPVSSPFTKKTAAEVRAGRPARARKEEAPVPSAFKTWEERLDKAIEEGDIPEELLQPASGWPQGDGAQLHVAEAPADVAREAPQIASMWPQGEAALDAVGDELEGPEAEDIWVTEDYIPCPLKCPYCDEPLVEIWGGYKFSIKWNARIGEWTQEEQKYTYVCSSCGSELDYEDLEDIPDNIM